MGLRELFVCFRKKKLRLPTSAEAHGPATASNKETETLTRTDTKLQADSSCTSAGKNTQVNYDLASRKEPETLHEVQLPRGRSLSEKLWNQAYDQIKLQDPNRVDVYEKILSCKLHGEIGASTDVLSQENEIKEGRPRWLQMQQLVESGLQKTENDAAANTTAADSIQVFNTVKGTIEQAVKTSPEATIAWVPVCFALEILMNPLTQASSNRSGVAYVVSRMDWYWRLSDLLLDKDMAIEGSMSLREKLEKNSIELYAALLRYQIKSVISYHRKRGSLLARDMVKLDDWEGELDAIKAMEESIRQDAAQFNTLEMRSWLEEIATSAEKQNSNLQTVISAIHNQTASQLEAQKNTVENQCLKQLYLTNPQDDNARVEDAKCGLLTGSYQWIFEDATFQTWLNNIETRILWIEGQPGQGKTMLMCGIIEFS